MTIDSLAEIRKQNARELARKWRGQNRQEAFITFYRRESKAYKRERRPLPSEVATEAGVLNSLGEFAEPSAPPSPQPMQPGSLEDIIDRLKKRGFWKELNEREDLVFVRQAVQAIEEDKAALLQKVTDLETQKLQYVRDFSCRVARDVNRLPGDRAMDEVVKAYARQAAVSVDEVPEPESLDDVPEGALGWAPRSNRKGLGKFTD